MEDRLEARAAAPADAAAPKTEVLPSGDSEESVVAADVAARSVNGTESESINVWPDETAEASFMAEARERGEPVGSAPARVAMREEAAEGESKALPPLETLVGRLSPEVRETLDDLFRAKFTAVRRVPKKAFKT